MSPGCCRAPRLAPPPRSRQVSGTYAWAGPSGPGPGFRLQQLSLPRRARAGLRVSVRSTGSPGDIGCSAAGRHPVLPGAQL